MATPSSTGTLTGAQKAAVLLIALGDQASAGLLKQLNEDQVQEVSGAIADLSSVTRSASGIGPGRISQCNFGLRARRPGGRRLRQADSHQRLWS